VALGTAPLPLRTAGASSLCKGSASWEIRAGAPASPTPHAPSVGQGLPRATDERDAQPQGSCRLGRFT
jgi:hypothetical protein